MISKQDELITLAC